MNVVLTRSLPGVTETLREHYDRVDVLGDERSLATEAGRRIFKEATVAICTLTDRIDASLIGENLKCLITYSVGFDHIDLGALKVRRIRLCHTPDVLTNATADLTWALILASSRELPAGQRLLRGGGFSGWRPEMLLGKAVTGARLGIVGMGRIGQAVAARARGFQMPVSYFSNRTLDPSLEEELEVTAVDFETLLRESDIISLHCPLNSQSHHLFGEAQLKMMKSDALLVNTARGAVIDEAALVAHLQSQPRFLAALDVFEREPELTPGLLDCRNALCLPHLGSADRPTREKMTSICITEAIAFAKGTPLMYEHKL